MRPFLRDQEWPGRRVRSTTPPPSQSEASTPETSAIEDPDSYAIIPAEQRIQAATALAEAREAVEDLERLARSELEEVLRIPTDKLPQTRTAVRYLAGTHPDYGTVMPTPDDDEILEGDNITAEVFDRAYDIMERGDRIAFGFDAKQIVSDDFSGKIRPLGPIDSPLKAAGRKPVQELDEELELEEGLEDRLSMSMRDMFYRVFQAVIAFVVRLLGDFCQAIGEKVDQILGFRFPVIRRIKVPFVAKPFFWLADVFHNAAERLERQAMGMQVDEPAVNPHGGEPNLTPLRPDNPISGYDDDGNPTYDEPSTLPLEEGDDVPYYPRRNSDQFSGGSGMELLMSAHRVLMTTESVARRHENAPLRDALQLYEQSRAARNGLTAYETLGTAWGVTPDQATTPDSPPPSPTPADPDAQPGDNFRIDCDD